MPLIVSSGWTSAQLLLAVDKSNGLFSLANHETSCSESRSRRGGHNANRRGGSHFNGKIKSGEEGMGGVTFLKKDKNK